MVRGRHSQVVLPHHARSVRQMARGESHALPGGHMFPLERPEQTAELLKSLLQRWQQDEEQP